MKKWILTAAVLCAAAGLFAKTAVIYHTGDTHGFFYPKNGRGGFAALAAVVKNGPSNYLLLDSGDFAEGTAETKNSRGLKAVQIMNKLGYHAATVGNHEFAYYDDGLKDMLAEAHFPFLAANLFEAETFKRPANVAPYQIFNADGVKIAVIGLANRTPTKPTQKYTFTKPLAALEQALERQDVQKADAVVVLVHDSLADDRPGDPFYVGDIARKYAGRVHAVLGGHAHKVIENERRNGVVYNEAGANLQYVGKITLKTDDKTGKLVSVRSELVALKTAKTGEDKEIAAYAESLREPGLDSVLGEMKQTLSRKPAGRGNMDAPADNWIADAGRAYAGTEVFVNNVGGARLSLERGPVSRRDLLDFFPFDDGIVITEVDGRFLKSLVKNALLPRNLLSYSGLSVTYRVNKKGKPVHVKVYVNGKPVQNRRLYTLGTNSYLARGKYFASVPEEKKKTTGNKTLRALLEEALAAGPVSAPRSGRIKQLP